MLYYTKRLVEFLEVDVVAKKVNIDRELDSAYNNNAILIL
jgi:hypothetical protein